MIKQITVTVLMFLIINLTMIFSVNAQSQNNRDDENLRNIKTKVARIFSEKRGKVTIKYKDGAKVKGYITEVRDDNFSISEPKSGKIAAVDYAQVSSVSNKSFPLAAKIGIGVAAGIGVLILIVGIGLSSSVN